MKDGFKPFDIASLLEDHEAIAYFLDDAFAEDDSAFIAHALGIAARAKGMTKVASDTGLAREALYRSFSEDGNPSLKSTIAVLKSLGFKLAIRPVATVEGDAETQAAE